MRVLLFLLLPYLVFSIKIGYINDYPFSYLDGNETKGIVVDIIKVIFDSYDIEVEFRKYEKNREFLIALKNEQVDMVLCVGKEFKYRNKVPIIYRVENDVTIYLYVGSLDNDLLNKVDESIKNFKATFIYKNFVKKYTTEKLWIKTVENSGFYWGLLIVFIIFFILFFVNYKLLENNHLNVKSLMYLILGSVIIVIADVLLVTQIYSIYFKIVGILVVSVGIYTIYIKYHDKFVVTILYILYVVLAIIFMMNVFHISIFYNLLTMFTVSMLIHNIAYYGIRKNILINIACVNYILYMLLITLGRANIIEFTNAYAYILLNGFILQMLSSIYREDNGYNFKDVDK